MSVATIQPSQGSLNVGTTPTVIGAYVVPGATTAICTGGSCANKAATTIKVSVSVWNGSIDQFFILYQVPIPAGGTIYWAGNDAKWTLGAGQGFRVVSDTATSVDATIGVVQFA
jgi:hypothetical protein